MPPKIRSFPTRRSSDLESIWTRRHSYCARGTRAKGDEPSDSTDSSPLARVPRDRKSTRLNSSHRCNLVCRLLLEKKKDRGAVHQPCRNDSFYSCFDAGQ